MSLEGIKTILSKMITISNQNFQEKDLPVFNAIFEAYIPEELQEKTWRDPELLYTFFGFNYYRAIRENIRKNFGNTIPESIISLFISYSSVSKNIINLCDVDIGCTHDVSRYLIRTYIKRVCNLEEDEEKILDFPQSRDYFMPAFGSLDDWLNFIDCYLKTLNGENIADFISIYNTLSVKKEQCLKEKKEIRAILIANQKRFKDDLLKIKSDMHPIDITIASLKMAEHLYYAKEYPSNERIKNIIENV